MSMREFDPAICCDHVKHGGAGWTECPRCGTKCSRDRDGSINGYSRGTKDSPRPIATMHGTRHERELFAE